MSTPTSNLVGGAVSQDIRHSYDPKDLAIFKRLGYSAVGPLARGMEAAAYVLCDNLVGKVWSMRSVESIQHLKRFYEDLADCDLPFATPLILQVHQVEDILVTVENRLAGVPFSSDLRSNETIGIERLIEVLSALVALDIPSAYELPVINEQPPPWRTNCSFEAGLIALLDRRVQRFGDQMRISVDRFDEKLAAIKSLLHRHPSSKTSLLHGDLGGGNLLVDGNFNVVSVLDFGFLTGPGDPRFDASITSGVFDMWSPRAQLRQHQFDSLLERDFGYQQEALLVLRAAYAIIVANAYDANGQDGQFWWSSTLLNRPDIHELLLAQ